MEDDNTIKAAGAAASVGARLLAAREAAGMTRTQLAGITKIPERHLAAIEAGDYALLPARTYSVGFSRSYARAVGEDEAAIVAGVRAELAGIDPEPARRPPQTFEVGDPARVPSSAFAWVAGLAAVVAILAGFAFWRNYYAPGGDLPSLIAQQEAAPVAPAPVAAPAQPTGGAVVFTALAPDIWVKFYDGAGKQLLQKQLAQGETYTVPADTPEVLIWTGRPEALAITVGGQAVPKLSDIQRTVKDVPVTATALLARGADGADASPVAVPTPAEVAASLPPRRISAPVRQRDSAPTRAAAAVPVEAAVLPAETAIAAPVPAPSSPTG